MIPPSTRKKRRANPRTEGADGISQEGSNHPSVEDDAIDAAIKRSIDKFGA